MSLETTILKEYHGLDTVISEDALILTTELSVGLKGDPGMSPYEEWLAQGNEGSYQDFLGSLGNGGLGSLSEAISEDENNRLKIGADEKLYVEDSFSPDPLAYYILAKG